METVCKGQLKKRAAELRAQGWTFKSIGAELETSLSTVYGWLNREASKNDFDEKIRRRLQQQVTQDEYRNRAREFAEKMRRDLQQSEYRNRAREFAEKMRRDLLVNGPSKTEKRSIVRTRLRSRLRSALKYYKVKDYREHDAISYLGCSLDDAVHHLEKQFLEGMGWHNCEEWHIDHIIPFNKFDLTDKEELFEVCHYTNLQPLWADDNLAKGAT